MINKQATYSSIKEWANTLKDYRLETVYFSVTAKPRVVLKSQLHWCYDPVEQKEIEKAFNQEVNRLMVEYRLQQAEFDAQMMNMNARHKLSR